MALQSVKNFISNGVANIFIDGEIGTKYIAEDFLTRTEMAIAQGAQKLIVHINSPGGSVMDGLSIFNAIKTFPGETETRIVGVAASIAGIISQAGKKRTMVDYGRLMIHNPQIPMQPGAAINDRQAEALAQIADVLRKILENNSKLDRSNVSTLMARESWFSAELALSNGFIDEIEDTNRRVGVVYEVEERAEGDFSTTEALLQMYNAYKQIDVKPKQPRMENLTNHLKLQKDASEDAILDAVKAIENKVAEGSEQLEERSNALSAIEQEKAALEAEVAELKKEKALTAVSNAIDKGLLSEDKKEEMEKVAIDNFTAFESVLSAVNTTSQAVTITDKLESEEVAEAKAPHAGKTFRELEKTNPKYLNELKNTNPEKFNAMFKEQYGVEFEG